MCMNTADVQHRLNLVSKQRWSFDLIQEIYGLDLSRDNSLTVQFKLWAGRYDKDLTAIGTDVDRWLFQAFLQDRELVPIVIAAPQLGLLVQDFEGTLQKMKDESYISPAELGGVFPSVFPKNFIRDLPERLPSFPRKTWGKRSSYVRAFHVAVAEDLDLSPTLLLCSAAEKLKDAEPEVSIERDIITTDPIGIHYQDWMDFKQPIALKPDACSIFTLAEYGDILSDYRMSKGKSALIDKALAVIREGA